MTTSRPHEEKNDGHGVYQIARIIEQIASALQLLLGFKASRLPPVSDATGHSLQFRGKEPVSNAIWPSGRPTSCNEMA
jgi:hypothetical protein